MTDSRYTQPTDEPFEEQPVPEVPASPELPPVPEIKIERPPEKTREPSSNRGNPALSFGIAMSVSTSLVVPIVAGALGGAWLDNRFGTTPIFALILLLLGVVIGFAQMFRLLNRLNREEERKR